jgi:hypothetical protein
MLGAPAKKLVISIQSEQFIPTSNHKVQILVASLYPLGTDMTFNPLFPRTRAFTGIQHKHQTHLSKDVTFEAL